MAEIISSDPFVPQRSSGFGADEPISDPFKPQPSSGFNPANAGFEDTGKLSGGAFSTGFKPTEAFSTGFEQHYSVSAADFNAVRTSLLEIQDKVSLALSTLESIAKVNTFSMDNGNQEQKRSHPDNSGLPKTDSLTSTGFH